MIDKLHNCLPLVHHASERDKIKAAANKRGMRLSDYVREKLGMAPAKMGRPRKTAKKSTVIPRRSKSPRKPR